MQIIININYIKKKKKPKTHAIPQSKIFQKCKKIKSLKIGKLEKEKR